jgi:hypothetical protein
VGDEGRVGVTASPEVCGGYVSSGCRQVTAVVENRLVPSLIMIPAPKISCDSDTLRI